MNHHHRVVSVRFLSIHSTLPFKLGVLSVALLSLSMPAAKADDSATQNWALASVTTTNYNPQTIAPIEVSAQRLDAARNRLSPETGSTVYRFDSQDIARLPLGDDTPLNQVILQSPGVVQDSYGQLHVRGDHSNLQYRINGIVIPEAISGFGQSLDTRFADHINILTGALPAQYGYRTAGVVDIHTKGISGSGGSISVLGGSNEHRETGLELYDSHDGLSYFLTGSYLRDNMGIENPTSEKQALHDETKQAKGFGYLSYVLDSDSRVSLMFGASNNQFQIPNVPGQAPAYFLDTSYSMATVNSAALDARQNEKNNFQVVSYQKSLNEGTDLQVSIFHRTTDLHYQPDVVGELAFNGVAGQILRKNESTGMQMDFSTELGSGHTLRSGLNFSHERATTGNHSLVFPADDDGNQTSGVPMSIVDNSQLAGYQYGIYLQDEWAISKTLTLNYGARYDKVNTVTNEQQLSPRLGVVYDLSPQTRIHAGYARYFTPPASEKIDRTSVQKFLNTTNALPSDANTSVKSERSNYFDVGLSHQLTKTITLGVDAYYRKVRNLQDEGQFGNALVYSDFNYDQGRIRGLELSASYRNQGLSGYVNLAWSKAEAKNIVTGQFNFDPDELAYIASHWVHLDHDQSYSASAGMSYQWNRTTLGADLLYGSGLRRGFANTDHLPAYTQVNLSVQQGFNLAGIGKIEGRLAMINAFDKIYQLRDGTGIGVGAPQYGPRRTFYVGLSKSFD